MLFGEALQQLLRLLVSCWQKCGEDSDFSIPTKAELALVPLLKSATAGTHHDSVEASTR